MTRPCFLVVDPEHPGSISTRKLVIESAKFNVITSYTAKEAIDTLRRFPAIDGIVLDGRMPDMPVVPLAETLKKISPVPIILVDSPGELKPEPVDYLIESLNPRGLLDMLQSLCPEATAYIEQHDRQLESEQES
ncbi:MAG: hypothetical protein NVSMB62_24780 [Acidobacteriaceae bacterium]